jgi:acyl-homoserine lactone acylase PvdQ
MRRFVAAVVVLLFAGLVPSGVGAETQVGPTDDHGTFLNILPAGQGTTTTSQDALLYETAGTIPVHDMDQYEMYSSLRLAKNLKDGDLSKYFKSESFIAPTGGDVESTESPMPGLTIIRDTFGVPHIYGDTRAAAMYGAGYVTAEDRLFEADVLRHLGRGRLSEFLGPSPANLAMDEASYQLAGYSEEELQAQVDRLHQFGALGDQVIQDGSDFVAGLNARIDEDNNDASKIPAEYPALQIQLAHWAPTDLVAVAEVIQARFAAGGGSELQDSVFLTNAQKKLGNRKGNRLWRDMRAMEEPTAPTTADNPFPYMLRKGIDPAAVAVPDPASVTQYDVVTSSSSSSGSSSEPISAGSPGESPLDTFRQGLMRLGLATPKAASNWLGVTGKYTKSGHPIAVMGPQVAYWSPEILMEMDIHGPGLNARGATFPGISLYVLLGRGQDYAWSATSGQSDLVDVRAEELCNKDGSAPTLDSTAYLFNGVCTDMYQRTDQWIAKPTAGGTGPPANVTASVKRTVHGPVFATGMVDGKPVAFTSQRTTFMGELDAAIPFIGLNGDGVTDPTTFKQSVSYLTGSFNWLYVDDQHVAYFHSGLYPIRAKGVDPDLPSWGTGQWEWKGFLPMHKHPQAVDPKKGWIDSWNNKPAPGWRAADGQWSYGQVHRVQALARQLAVRIPKGNVTRADMVQIMANAATIDLRGQEDLPYLLKALGPVPKKQAKARSFLLKWAARDTRRIDRNGDGEYEDQEAVALFDAWWPNLIHAMFDGQLDGLYDLAPIPFDDTGRFDHVGSSFINGYYGYVQKALQMALGLHPKHPYRVLRCADGTLKGCRKALRASFTKTIADLGEDTSLWNADEAADNIVYTAVGLISLPEMPWQNRPTFQQVVEATSHR